LDPLRQDQHAASLRPGLSFPSKKKSKIKKKKEKPKKKKKKKKKKSQRKKKKKRSVKTEAQLRGSGLPSLLHLKTEDQFPISACRLRFTFPSILETDAYWLAVTAFKGSGLSPFPATFQRWTKKKEKKFESYPSMPSEAQVHLSFHT